MHLFAERWPEDYARKAKSTNRKNKYAVRHFVAEYGQTRLIDLDWHKTRAWGRTRPENERDTLRAMFNDAINDGLYLESNPFGNLRIPRSRGRKDLKVITEAHLHELADCAIGAWGEYGRYMIRPLILFAAYTITRPGELFFIERADVLRDAAELLVLDADDGTGKPKPPKSGKGRTSVLPPPVIDAISVIPPRLDVPWLFYTKRGCQFSKSTLYYYWNPVRTLFGRPGMDFYELKHFGCSFMVNELRIDAEDVAVQAGQRDHGRLIRELYGHADEDLARERIKRAYMARPWRSSEGRS